MLYTLKVHKLYWATETKKYRAGWAYMDGKPCSSGIYITEDRQEALALRKILRRKFSTHAIRLVEIGNSGKAENLTYAKLMHAEY